MRKDGGCQGGCGHHASSNPTQHEAPLWQAVTRPKDANGQPISMTQEEIDAHPLVKAVRAWRFFNFSLFALFLIVIDQLSKTLVFSRFTYGERLEILPVFDLTLVFNRGAAFGFLSDHDGWQRWFFLILAVGISIILGVLTYKPSTPKWRAIAYSLIMAGALGNAIDRFLHGYVIDFILVYWNEYFFPAFNFADSCITIGVILLIIEELFFSRKKVK
ncbi:signal peptidase II [Basilea psittacipulmonis]|uniref:signal peptidase II n=1 Tax=Basilea psittacipulmonis TaxID=1472345 RepID=UPI000A86A059|nr:signal peptidase II [Basilea psittacipulmonis]